MQQREEMNKDDLKLCLQLYFSCQSPILFSHCSYEIRLYSPMTRGMNIFQSTTYVYGRRWFESHPLRLRTINDWLIFRWKRSFTKKEHLCNSLDMKIHWGKKFLVVDGSMKIWLARALTRTLTDNRQWNSSKALSHAILFCL